MIYPLNRKLWGSHSGRQITKLCYLFIYSTYDKPRMETKTLNVAGSEWMSKTYFHFWWCSCRASSRMRTRSCGDSAHRDHTTAAETCYWIQVSEPLFVLIPRTRISHHTTAPPLNDLWPLTKKTYICALMIDYISFKHWNRREETVILTKKTLEGIIITTTVWKH